MPGPSKIDWTQWTLEVTGGCTECSPGCRNCFARRIIWRLAHNPTCGDKYQGLVEKINGKLCWTGRIKLFPEHLEPVLRRKIPTRYFVDSRSDLFHTSVPFSFVDEVFNIIEQCPEHTFQILTKRPEDLMAWSKAKCAKRYLEICKNVHLGVSVCTPDEKHKIDTLRKIPAAKRFISFEPLIEDVGKLNLEGIDQVIVGGESGPGARPCHPDWVRSIRDQCKAPRVPFFFKGWGKYFPDEQLAVERKIRPGSIMLPWLVPDNQIEEIGGQEYYRVGKKKAGHLLDGEEYRELAV